MYLLHKETDGICDLDSCVVCEWEAVARRQSTAPGSGQENLNIAQILRRDSTDALCAFGSSAPGDSTACERRHEFYVELDAGISQTIVGGWRFVVS